MTTNKFNTSDIVAAVTALADEAQQIETELAAIDAQRDRLYTRRAYVLGRLGTVREALALPGTQTALEMADPPPVAPPANDDADPPPESAKVLAAPLAKAQPRQPEQTVAQKIETWLETHDGTFTTKELAKEIGANREHVAWRVGGMVHEGKIMQLERAKYQRAGVPAALPKKKRAIGRPARTSAETAKVLAAAPPPPKAAPQPYGEKIAALRKWIAAQDGVFTAAAATAAFPDWPHGVVGVQLGKLGRIGEITRCARGEYKRAEPMAQEQDVAA